MPDVAVQPMSTPNEERASPAGHVPAERAATVEGHAGHGHADRRTLRIAVRMLLVAVVLLGLIRIFVFDPYAIPTGSMKPTILEGDVLLVEKLSYTIRSLKTIPFTDIRIPYIEIPGL